MSGVRIMPNEIAYRSFCWSLGTTSFRTKEFNLTIERQLSLLDEFWAQPENAREAWAGNGLLQGRYYHFLQSRGFVEGNAPRPAKDAREKTSGLVNLGLIHKESRHLTAVGSALLEISRARDFSADSFLQIPKDSYLYLKQLLKVEAKPEKGNDWLARPFLVLLHLLKIFGALSLEEFTYLVPLCTDANSTQCVIDGIARLRAGDPDVTLDDIILRRLMMMDNYQAARQLLLDRPVDEDLIATIGINRKSRRYDRHYFPLYQALRAAYWQGDQTALIDVFSAIKDINIGVWWRKYIFDTSSAAAIRQNPTEHLRPTRFDSVASESEFKAAFFETMHLLKAKATLKDYYDLNRRYIKLSDAVLFADGQVKLDIVPRHFFGAVDDDLYALAYTSAPNLFENCPLEEISPCLATDETELLLNINAELGTRAATVGELRQVLEDNRYERLARMMDEKFTDDKLLQLLDAFETRNDGEIQSMVTDNADIPTIFEYVLGILWYKVSECQGRILDYMKLSLDADLLPVSHAVGGEADIVYEYQETEAYPEHCLLLEATLADGTNQRRMEMEPVSRHLGQHILRNLNENTYCIFVTTYLDLNVLSDFCSRRNSWFYEPAAYEHWDEARRIPGMRIIPLRTEELKKLLRSHMTYAELYPRITVGYVPPQPPHLWYQRIIESIWPAAR